MTAAEVLLAVRARALAQIADLTRDLEQMMAAAESSNADDEHDPEGATLAFERAQVGALLAQARARFEDIEHALRLLESGEYGRCAGCGGPIGVERLAARPASRTCISCAGRD